MPAKQAPTAALRLPTHTSPRAHPRITSLPPKDTAPSPTTAPNPRAHPPTTRPNIPQAFLRRRASTRASTATKARRNNTRRTASTGKYQARRPAHLLRNTAASRSTRRVTGTSRRPRRTGATSRAGTMGGRRRTLRLRVSTQAREGTVRRTAGCHTTTAAILRTRRAGCSVIYKGEIGLLDDPSWETFRRPIRSIESG